MAHVAINALSLRRGGGLQVMAGLLARFSEANHYSVLCSDQDSRERFEAIIGPRSHVTYIDPLGQSSNVVVFLWGMRKQAAWLADNDADCVFGVNHHFPSGSVPQIIYHLNVLRFERPGGPLWKRGEIAERLRDRRAAVALRRADANLFESDFIRTIAGRARGDIRNPKTVYIGLDDRIPGASSQDGPTGATILAVTSEAPHKDNATLVRMLAELVRQRPEVPWTLRIVGGGPDEFSDIKALADNLNVVDRLDFTGFLGHSELSAEGRRAFCLVTASLAESFCMVALEAMNWGCPVVVADISAMPESIGEAGLLARPSDAADFAAQVLRLYDDPTLRADLVLQGRERAASMTWSAAARDVEGIFAILCTARGDR